MLTRAEVQPEAGGGGVNSVDLRIWRSRAGTLRPFCFVARMALTPVMLTGRHPSPPPRGGGRGRLNSLGDERHPHLSPARGPEVEDEAGRGGEGLIWPSDLGLSRLTARLQPTSDARPPFLPASRRARRS